MTCGTAEENLANNLAMRDHLRDVGMNVAWGEVRQGHTWTCWRDSLAPAPRRPADPGVVADGAPPGRARRPRLRPGRHGDPLRPLGPAGAGLPERARPGVGLREQRHGRRGGRPRRRRPLQALLRRLLRRADLVGLLASRSRSGPAGTVPTRAGSSTAWSRGSAQDSPGSSRRRRHRLLDGRLPRAAARAHPRRPVPGRASARAATTTRPTGTRGASAARRRTSPTPATTSRTCTATTSTGCASGCTSCWSSARDRGRPTRPARCRRRGTWAGCWPRRASRTSSTCGATTPPTTGTGGSKQIAHHLPRFV